MTVDVLPILKHYGDHPSAYLATNDGVQHFNVARIRGCIAYQPSGRKHLFMVGGIFCDDNDKRALLEAFIQFSSREGRKIVAVQILQDDARLLSEYGFTVNQLGASYSGTLATFTTKGTKFMSLRNKISRAKRSGVEVLELHKDLPATPEITEAINLIDELWLKSKGKNTKELAFLVGQVGDPLAESVQKRIFLAKLEGKLVGYILYTRCYGRYNGWMHDLTRKRPDLPPGVMEHINLSAIERFREEGEVEFINYGFTPLTNLSPEYEIANSYSPVAAWVLKKLSTHGSKIYPAKTQLEYKIKWKPDIILPEYLAFQGGFTFSGLWSLLKITNAI